MEKNYIKIGENLYRYNRHRYIKKKCEYCGEVFFCRNDKINSKNTCNKKCYQSLVEKNNLYFFDEKTLEVITGSLLSDGCITKGYNAKNYHFTHFSMYEEYVDFILDTINIELTKHYVKPNKIGKYTSKGGYNIQSKYSVSFTELRNKWYPLGKKIIPHDIKITPLVLLHWYLGDGSISNENGVILCTDSFDEESMDILLYGLYDLGFLPRKTAKNRIIIPNKRIIEFFNYIDECPIECFKYKWETIITTSYLNRKCLNCNSIFDAEYNHNIYCSDKCSKEKSYNSGYNLKEIKKFI